MKTEAFTASAFTFKRITLNANNMQEIWKDIPNYEGMYQVSNLGNVKSFKLKNEIILKFKTDRGGYRFHYLSKERKQKFFYVHQLVMIAFCGHKPDGTHKVVVDHINNIKTDNRLENLQLISQRHNSSKDVKNKTSQYTGVWYDSGRKKYGAGIKINGKKKYLGRFITEYEAHLAYQNELKNILCKN